MIETNDLPTFASEEAALIAAVGQCCMGSNPYCAAGCLVEIAVKKRAAMLAKRAETPSCDGAGREARLVEIAKEIVAREDAEEYKYRGFVSENLMARLKAAAAAYE